jgi:hypothetical protein
MVVGERRGFGAIIRLIFIGADGLRAGWSIALFFAMTASIQHYVVAAFHHFHRMDPDQLRHIARYPSDLLITEGVPFLAVALASFLMSRIEGRALSAYGIGPTPGAGRQFLAGICSGAGLLSILVLLLWRMHLLVFDGFLLTGSAALRYGLEWAVGFLCVALFEEYISRGFVQFTVARGIAGPLRFTRVAPYATAIGFWTFTLISSHQFGIGHSHNTHESTIGLWCAGLLGLVQCLSLWRTGSLWWAIGLHVAWDWAQSFVYGVADSGHMVDFHLLGSHPAGVPELSGALVGPEGSLLALPILVLSAVLVLVTLRKTGWPPPGSKLAIPPVSPAPGSGENSAGRVEDLPLVR